MSATESPLHAVIGSVEPLPFYDSLWFLLPLTALLVWGWMRIYRTHIRNSVESDETRADDQLPGDGQALVVMIREEVRDAEKRLDAKAQILSDLVAQVDRRSNQLGLLLKEQQLGGESILLEPERVDQVAAGDGADPRQEAQRMLGEGQSAEQVASETGLPIGEIALISRLMRRNWSEST